METYLSVIIPVYNEEENIKILHEKIKNAVEKISESYEIIYVDDGSKDNSFSELKLIKDENTKIIKFSRNFGQTAALSAGINNSNGKIIIAMDADLQNSPDDISKLLDKYNQGYDLVSGWRKNRFDNCIRTVPSKIANYVISKITKTGLHDTGCTLKAYNGDILRKINLFADHHRFIPAIFAEYSNKITELEVSHYPRLHGKSKYNIFRTFRVILDLIAISYWKNYKNKPIYFWGSLSLILFGFTILALILLIVALISKLSLSLCILLTILFCLFICNTILLFAVGLIFENIIRLNLNQNKDAYYVVEEIL